MNKFQRKKTDNWYPYYQYISIHEEILNRFADRMVNYHTTDWPIKSETQVLFDSKFELMNGFKISITKRANASKDERRGLECETNFYKYIAIHEKKRLQIRYCSPHTNDAGTPEDVNWDFENHRHKIDPNDSRFKEKVIVYMPFDLPKKLKPNRLYTAKKLKTAFEIKLEPWPQIEDFIKEISEIKFDD
jgi:hypothetical protein